MCGQDGVHPRTTTRTTGCSTTSCHRPRRPARRTSTPSACLSLRLPGAVHHRVAVDARLVCSQKFDHTSWCSSWSSSPEWPSRTSPPGAARRSAPDRTLRLGHRAAAPVLPDTTSNLNLTSYEVAKLPAPTFPGSAQTQPHQEHGRVRTSETARLHGFGRPDALTGRDPALMISAKGPPVSIRQRYQVSLVARRRGRVGQRDRPGHDGETAR